MTTITKITIAVVLALSFVATSASAIAIYKTQDNDSFIKISNMLIDSDGVTNYKFTDKVGSSTVTCYGSYSKRSTSIGNIVDSNAISCVK